MNFTLISKGSRKAEIVVRHEDGTSETRHLVLGAKGWTDRFGNTYNL